jgi:oligopeptide transport system substrate-binding protein
MRFFCVFLFLCSLFSCSSRELPKDSSKRSMARINILSDPCTLDPRKSRSLNDRILTSMLFDGLTRRGKEGEYELALAKDVCVSEEGKRYTFSLKNAYWSNGDRIAAKDFIYAWKKSLSPDFISENAYQLFCIKNAKEIKLGLKPSSELGAYAIGEDTLQVDLENPIPYFLELLSFSIFFPFHEEMDKASDQWISCGPFSLKKWKHNESIEVVKNNRYWDKDAVLLDSIFMTMVEENTEVQMFKNGELDWAGSPISTLPLDCLKEAKEQKILHSSPLLGTSFFRINTSEFPLNNVNIRRAFSFVIHRQEMIENILQGGQKAALRFIPNMESSYFQDADIAQSQKLFSQGVKELGMSPKSFPKITLLHSSDHRSYLISQAVQYYWKHFLGVEIALEVSEPKTYYSRVRNGDYQIALGSWIADYEDPENFLEVFKYQKSSTNNTGWESDTYANILDLARALPKEERAQKLQECEQILMEESPIIPLYHFVSLYLKSSSLQGVVLSPTGNLDFKWAYINPSETKEAL